MTPKGEELTVRDVELLLDQACREMSLSRAQAKLKIQREGTHTLALLHIQNLMTLLKYAEKKRR